MEKKTKDGGITTREKNLYPYLKDIVFDTIFFCSIWGTGFLFYLTRSHVEFLLTKEPWKLW